MLYEPSDMVVEELEFDQKYWTSSEFGHVKVK